MKIKKLRERIIGLQENGVMNNLNKTIRQRTLNEFKK